MTLLSSDYCNQSITFSLSISTLNPKTQPSICSIHLALPRIPQTETLNLSPSIFGPNSHKTRNPQIENFETLDSFFFLFPTIHGPWTQQRSEIEEASHRATTKRGGGSATTAAGGVTIRLTLCDTDIATFVLSPFLHSKRHYPPKTPKQTTLSPPMPAPAPLMHPTTPRQCCCLCGMTRLQGAFWVIKQQVPFNFQILECYRPMMRKFGYFLSTFGCKYVLLCPRIAGNNIAGLSKGKLGQSIRTIRKL